MKRLPYLPLLTLLYAIACNSALAETAAPPIQVNPQQITEASLQGVQLLEFVEGATDFTPDEVAQVTAFVKQGGSLLIVIDEENRTPLLQNGVSRIMEPFGLQFSSDIPYLHNCGAIAEPGLIHAGRLELPYSGGRETIGGTPFAWRLDENGEKAGPFAAFVQTENGGRIVALAEGMAYRRLGTANGERLSGVPRNPAKTTYWGKDSNQFMQDIYAWLLAD